MHEQEIEILFNTNYAPVIQEHRLQSQRCKHGGKEMTSQHDRVQINN
jgi:hypothetical protein